MNPRGRPAINAAKTQCDHGHRIDDPADVYLVTRGDRPGSPTHRHCRECHRRNDRESYRRRKQRAEKSADAT